MWGGNTYIETVLIHLAHVCFSLLSHVPEGKKVIDPAGFFLKLHFPSAQCFLDVQNIAKTIELLIWEHCKATAPKMTINIGNMHWGVSLSLPPSLSFFLESLHRSESADLPSVWRTQSRICAAVVSRLSRWKSGRKTNASTALERKLMQDLDKGKVCVCVCVCVWESMCVNAQTPGSENVKALSWWISVLLWESFVYTGAKHIWTCRPHLKKSKCHFISHFQVTLSDF